MISRDIRYMPHERVHEALAPLVPMHDDQIVYSIHRWVRRHIAEDYVRLGWIPQATLDGTSHGHWSVHVIWICQACRPVEPKREG